MDAVHKSADYYLRLQRRNGDRESWENEATFEIARLLSVIANRLDAIAERLPMAGKGF